MNFIGLFYLHMTLIKQIIINFKKSKIMGTTLFLIYLLLSSILLKKELKKDGYTSMSNMSEAVTSELEEIISDTEDVETQLNAEIFFQEKKHILVPTIIILLYLLWPLILIRYRVSIQKGKNNADKL